jgi:hypothetical protein
VQRKFFFGQSYKRKKQSLHGADHRFHLKQSEKALILAVDGVKGLAGAYRVLQEVRGNCGE